MRKFNKGLMFLLIIAFVLAVYVSAATDFKDIKDTDWFAEAVGKLNVLKIIDGLPDGTFNPQGRVTRAQFVKMLVQAMEYKKIDSVSFEDLKPFPTSKPHWACVYIETALRNG
ncbi:MAG TPA: S-layer homology domain-containing protein, partial [Bacillota bacterium]|nr:S-layer homology domain-containing protein [Bacillota bacterium]